MKTIKVIDLLSKIANGEEVPKKILYEGISYFYDKDNDIYREEYDKDTWFFSKFITERILDDEVEIIEEDKKIEKILPTSLKGIDNLDEKIEVAHIDTISAIDKINEIIDYINK